MDKSHDHVRGIKFLYVLNHFINFKFCDAMMMIRTILIYEDYFDQLLIIIKKSPVAATSSSHVFKIKKIVESKMSKYTNNTIG